MESLKKFTDLLVKKENLVSEQVRSCIDLLVSDKVGLTDKECFLSALAQKGETVQEITSFINYFRELARDPGLEKFAGNAIDLCGTGGDKAGSFNISTFVSFLVASSGTPVIKHGNRSISSKCGSADLIEAVGIPLEMENEKLLKSMNELNYAFLFAPSFHTAFKNIAPVRKSLANKGVITIFNILGPMINPARPSFQLLGVYSRNLVSKIGNALNLSGNKGGFVVHGCLKNKSGVTGVDELTSSGENIVCGIGRNSNLHETSWNAEEFGLSYEPFEDLKGGDLKRNLNLMNALLNNEAPTGLTNSILMNASVAFLAAGRSNDLKEGVEIAKKLLRDGVVKNWLHRANTLFN